MIVVPAESLDVFKSPRLKAYKAAEVAYLLWLGNLPTRRAQLDHRLDRAIKIGEPRGIAKARKDLEILDRFEAGDPCSDLTHLDLWSALGAGYARGRQEPPAPAPVAAEQAPPPAAPVVEQVLVQQAEKAVSKFRALMNGESGFGLPSVIARRSNWNNS